MSVTLIQSEYFSVFLIKLFFDEELPYSKAQSNLNTGSLKMYTF